LQQDSADVPNPRQRRWHRLANILIFDDPLFGAISGAPHRGRHELHLAAGAAVLPALPGIAKALDNPTRPVRIMVGYPPGGPSDIVARLIGQFLSGRLNQPFIIENRPGAGGNVGTETVVRAAPDGYTLLLVGSPNAINAAVCDNLNFNFIRDIAPVAEAFIL
jgi:tripartite-type tricarboxylate transporter receptor subunit TctC